MRCKGSQPGGKEDGSQARKAPEMEMAARELRARDSRLDEKGVWMETVLWDGDEKLWRAPPSDEPLPAARARIHRGCVEPCPDQTEDSCPTKSPPSIENALPVAHAPS